MKIRRDGIVETTQTQNTSPATNPASFLVNTTGDNIVIAANSTKKIKLLWYNIQAKSGNGADVTAILKGTINGIVTQINIGDYKASQPFAHSIGAGQKSFLFDTNTPVLLNLSAWSTPVYFNAEYDLVL